MHRAEALDHIDRLGSLREATRTSVQSRSEHHSEHGHSAGRSNSYKCTEQKETFLCFLGMGNNPMVGATVAVAVATAEAMNK